MSSDTMDLLHGLSPEDATQLLALGAARQLSAGEVLFRLGEPAGEIFLVRSGRISLTLPIQVRGREEDVLIEEKLTGETLGWSGLIPPHRFTLKAAAAMQSDLLALPRAALLRHFAERPEIAYAVTGNVASVIGRRLEVFQTMWLREVQRAVEHRYA